MKDQPKVHETSIENCFQSLSDSLRLRLVKLLVTSSDEACLCEFVDSLGEPKYKISKGLKKLREAGLILAEKDGRWVYHRLATEPDQCRLIFHLIENLTDLDGTYAADYARFKARLSYREYGRCRVSSVPTSALDAVKREAS